MNRRRCLAFGLALAATFPLSRAARAAAPAPDTTWADDFDELWSTLRDRYCYFGEKKTDWKRVRTLYRPQALAAGSQAAFIDVVRRVLNELYDAHTHLNDPPEGAPRWPLYDVLAERRGAAVRVAAVATGSAAASAGVVAGDTIVAIDGQTIDVVARQFMPRCLAAPDRAADAYALNVAVAGHRGAPRSFTVQRADGERLELVLPLQQGAAPRPDVEWRRLDGDLGYIAIRSFGDEAVAQAFDRALLELRHTRGLVIDVRYNVGGDTAVARPIMGRFITQRMPYARMRRREGSGLGPAWTEYVDPTGPFTCTAPVVVLTSPWSASMAEGFPMGMRSIGRATIVGTPMMGLGAAVYSITLDRTGVRAQYSAEPVYDIHGTPRSHLLPDVTVAADADILAAGIRALRA